ncbi:AraC family transcriptional regulator [Cupriavidus necator]|nr:AraC family transcriptional regulator [Cupriavidus necator]
MNDCAGDSGAPLRNRMRFGPGAAGIERAEAQFHDHAFAPHRHATYAIGITLSGVQTFRYRGETRHCLPGECHILHPDELHDGRAGTPEGFGYRIVYVDPALVQQALGGRALPFVPDPVVGTARIAECLATGVWNLDDAVDALSGVDIVASVTQLLLDAAGHPSDERSRALALPALMHVRELIIGDSQRELDMETLERAAGLDRWTIARQFRVLFGTSPGRFRTQCQLARVRGLLMEGASLSAAAIEAGFADQSHMTRQFKGAFGVTPGRWVEALSGRAG